MENNEITEEEMASFISRTLNKVKTESDIKQLNVDRKLFRKLVPFSMRSYFASYLIRHIVSGRQRDKRKTSPKVLLAPEASTTLFFNVGRSRKVFYKDIIFLIMKNAETKREDIGEIKIHNNYSFVQVANEAVNPIIEKLQNIDYRGKKLVVNLANEKVEVDD